MWLTEYVRSHWPHTAVIMATGLDNPEIVLQSRRLGAVGYVVKPFTPGMMRQAVDLAAGRIQFRPSARLAQE
jgi:DNA-binding NarL/FixJ family response regulator